MSLLRSVGLGLAVLLGLPCAARADALSAAFTILAPGHPDTQHGLGASPGMVEATLGSSGLPVRSALSQSSAIPSIHINDINAASEILWWLPGNRPNGATVTVDASYGGIVTIPANGLFDQTLFPNGGSANGPGHGFTAAHLFGTYVAQSPVSGTFGSDDDGWIFVDGQLYADRGGVQDYNFGIISLPAGTHSIDIFFADRQTSESQLSFLAPGAVFSPVPEPASLFLLGCGLLGIALARQRR